MSDAASRLRALAAALAQAPGEAASVRAQALALVRAQTLATPAERVAAAELLVGSDVPAEVEAAQTLALAAFGALPAARPLAATAFDRLRLLAGAPQKFGTQTAERDGVRALWPVDPATTDSERVKWGLPALAELRRQQPARRATMPPMPILPPTADAIAFAAAALRRGELVGMPTETVYGLAALASDPVAVARTFAAKRRPSDNPLIVHLAAAADLPLVARAVPPAAQALAAAFWPGPLTLVLPRQPSVLAAVTAGGDTVAVRVPDHPVALALLRAVGGPLTAPSANTFMRLSPTTAADIEPELQAQLACTLDGGPCRVGLESTVVDCAGPGPLRVLRPGGVPRQELARALGGDVPLATASAAGPRPAPGMYARHYAPRTPLRLAQALGADDAGLCFGPPANARQVAMPADPASYGAALYRVLHALDALAARELVVQAPPTAPAWEAVADRLRKAAAGG